MHNPLKIIFLDVDGVLNSWRNILAHGRMPWPNYFETPLSPYEKQASEMCGPEDELDLMCIKMIQRLCKETGAQIVLHSMWRRHVDPVAFGKRHKLPIIDKTDARDEKAYGIFEWLWDRPAVSHFCIIDDDDIFDNMWNPGDVKGAEAKERSEKLWEKMKDVHIQTQMSDGFSFVDFCNAFLQLDDVDLGELSETNDRIQELTHLQDLMFLGKDERTQEEREAAKQELADLEGTMTYGRWAVAMLMRNSANANLMTPVLVDARKTRVEEEKSLESWDGTGIRKDV